jgi:hypothetical protein
VRVLPGACHAHFSHLKIAYRHYVRSLIAILFDLFPDHFLGLHQHAGVTPFFSP